MRKLIVALALFFAPVAALAQTAPFPKPSTNVSGTIAVTNTFQSVIASALGRASCSVQNNGSNAMYVFFGPIANATTSNSVKLSTGQSVSCTAGGVVLTDQVSITGTNGDVFFAAWQ